MARTKIILLGPLPVINEEESALEALTPGHLIMLTSTGVQKNTAAGVRVAMQFALERDELGQGISTAYAIGDKVKAGSCHAGHRVYAFIASGVNVAKGAYLTPDNVGLFKAVGSDTPTARALEAVNATVTPTRIRIEIV